MRGLSGRPIPSAALRVGRRPSLDTRPSPVAYATVLLRCNCSAGAGAPAGRCSVEGGGLGRLDAHNYEGTPGSAAVAGPVNAALGKDQGSGPGCHRLGLGCLASLRHGASRPIPRSRSLRSVGGRRSFTAGCVLRPCRARPPAKPQGSCLCLAGRCALPHAPWQPKTAAGCCDVFFLLHRPRKVMLRAPTSRAAALPTLWVPPLTSLPSALVPVAQGGKKQLPQQPALRARGRRA